MNNIYSVSQQSQLAMKRKRGGGIKKRVQGYGLMTEDHSFSRRALKMGLSACAV